MSGEMMLFPATVEEFMEQYKVVDRDHALSNGAEFVPVFRMRQWFDHLQAFPITNADRIRSMTDEELATFLYNFGDCPCFGVKFCERGTRCEDAVLMKLREPFDNGACSADETSEKVQGGE